MNGIAATLSQAVYSPAHDSTGRSLAMVPKNWHADGSKTGVILAHGAGGSEQDAWSSVSTNIKKIMQSVAQVRPVLACNFGGDEWGNATSVLQMADAFTYLVSTLGAKPGKVILMGRSMAHLTVANWARQHVSSVSCIACFAGVSDLQNLYAQGGGNATSIDTAYSTWNNGTMGATYNPTVYAANGDFGSIPWRNYYATDDTTVPQSTVTALAALIGASAAAISMGTGGHTDTPLANIDIANLLAWIRTQAGD